VSRLGRRAIAVPAGTTCEMEADVLKVKGPRGEESVKIPNEVSCVMENGSLSFSISKETKRAGVLWGLVRSLASNAVKGVSEGFATEMKLQGVGYRSSVQGQQVKLQAGFSHDVLVDIPKGVEVKTKGTTELTVSGVSKQLVGQFVANLQSYRPPEPYKGKGIHRVGQYLLRKEGKKK